MHDHQVFKDGREAYVWIYDPDPIKAFLIGLLLLFGMIALCTMRIWPRPLRIAFHYFGMSCGGFAATAICVMILRFVVFCLIWLLSMGKIHFWLLPNLTSDLGFFETFVPFYTYEFYYEKKVKKID